MTAEALGQLLAELAEQHGRLTVLVHYTVGARPWMATLAADGRQAAGHGGSAFDAIADALERFE